MNHLREQWAKLSWREPDTIRGYPLPLNGQFASSKDFLDPEIFNKQDKMHPWIREPIMGILGAFWESKYGANWLDWTRIYLAGSLASYWWGTPDFDTLIGVRTIEFTKTNSKFAGMSDAEVCEYLTHELITELDPFTKHFSFPPAEDASHIIKYLSGKRVHFPVDPGAQAFGPMEMTFFVNPAAWDIRAIKPYAAYEITHDKWYVHPIRMDKTWGAHALDHAFWEHMADVADEIKDALAHDPEKAAALYHKVHDERGQAFSPTGHGITDKRSLQWITLNRWGLLGPLELAAHPDRPMDHIPPALARKYL